MTTDTLDSEAGQKYLRRHYNADSPGGLLLLALRPGRMCLDQLYNRFGDGWKLMRRRADGDGFIAKVDGYIMLTERGRAHCPKRAG